VLQEAAQKASPEVRVAAVRAYRLVPGSEVDGTLAAVMARDADETVRNAAVFAASFRPVEPFVEPLRDVLDREPSAAVRATAVGFLGRNVKTAPEIAALVERAATHDPAESIRALARGYLDRSEAASAARN
jgi:hypothetical protein